MADKATNPTTTTTDEAPALRLPSGKRYFTESQVLEILGWTRRALLQRPEGQRPPCVKLSPRKRIYAADELETWLNALPRQR